MELSFNIWDADELGNGDSNGWRLTAYIVRDGSTMTQYFSSVPLTPSDAKAFLDGDYDEQWFYSDHDYYDSLCEVFILQTIFKEGSKNV